MVQPALKTRDLESAYQISEPAPLSRTRRAQQQEATPTDGTAAACGPATGRLGSNCQSGACSRGLQFCSVGAVVCLVSRAWKAELKGSHLAQLFVAPCCASTSLPCYVLLTAPAMLAHKHGVRLALSCSNSRSALLATLAQATQPLVVLEALHCIFIINAVRSCPTGVPLSIVFHQPMTSEQTGCG